MQGLTATYILADLDRRTAMHFQLLGRMLSDESRWHRYPWIQDPYYERLARHGSRLVGMGEFYLQREPCLRVHPPGGTCVPWHTDAQFGHQPSEWNVWVPLTTITDETQTIWLTDPDGERFPAMVRTDQALIFNGGSQEHGNQVNATTTERRSFDFRLLPREGYVPGGRTVKYGVSMTLGEYWVAL